MFELDLKSRKPIYEQLIDNFKELIINGVLRPDEQIPSVRELAAQITINPNTIQKAYRELERQGYIYSVRGRGNYVSEKIKKVDEDKVEKLKNEITKNLLELIYMGLKKEDLLYLVEKVYQDTKGGKSRD